jgi:5-(carboxyamino)imidazole ribonucleotide synthase
MTQTVGIMGDGQLGMLLCEAAPALGLKTVMLCSDARGPAAQRAALAIEGSLDDAEALASLIGQCDVITFEREDIPPAAIAQLREAEARDAVQCFPRLDTIALLQDKALQKRWLADQDLSTLPFLISTGAEDSVHDAVRQLGFPLVQKSLRGGFDGRGVQILGDEAALAAAWPGNTLFEQYAGAFSEIAVLVVRGRDGTLAHFGPVDMTFEASHAVLDTVTAPSAQPEPVQTRAVELARAAIARMDGVGVFGVEMFVLDGDAVCINEISPRVHNAGHYTLDACATSQFEMHLRAVCGMPLGDTALRQPACMRNILCTAPLHAAARTEIAGRYAAQGHFTYWYGKSPARLMRKLGHVSAMASSPALAQEAANAGWMQIQKDAGGRR